MSILGKFDVVKLVDPFGTLGRDYPTLVGKTAIISEIWGESDEKPSQRVIFWRDDNTTLECTKPPIDTEFGGHGWVPSYYVTTSDGIGDIAELWVSEEEVEYIAGRECNG